MLGAVLVLAGCRGGGTDLMPLEAHNRWTYEVSAGLTSRIDAIEVTRHVAIAGAEGAELSGPSGVTRMGWRNGVLWMNVTPSGRFDPPVPLLRADMKPDSWHGRLDSMGKSQPASATLEHRKLTINSNGKQIQTVSSILAIKLRDREIEIQTWFSPGVGIVRQEQRTRTNSTPSGERDVAMQLKTGP